MSLASRGRAASTSVRSSDSSEPSAKNVTSLPLATV